jgi:hypothetical protein
VSKASARPAAQLLNIIPYETTVNHTLQPRDPASGVYFCSWLLQSVIGETNRPLAFFSDEAWFHLQGYINTQNNRYWSSQNPHLTHEVQPHLVKVGVWCAVSPRIAVPVFFNETINCERYLRAEGQHFQRTEICGL